MGEGGKAAEALGVRALDCGNHAKGGGDGGKAFFFCLAGEGGINILLLLGFILARCEKKGGDG